MAVPYFHMRVFWGAFDVSYGTPEYTGAALVSGGSSAAAGSGVGVRRALLVFDRTAPGALSDDVAEMHFDFMNITGGAPDDTWTTTDFTDMETVIGTWWASVKDRVHTDVTLREIRWYRVGTGVTPPNPAERITPVGVAGTSTGQSLPPQVAISITFKTARRKQWGRTYLPSITTDALTTDGAISTTVVDDIAAATGALATTAAAGEFYLGVTSNVAGSFFAVEQIQVDDIFDVIRRRRWKHATYRKVLP